MAIRLKHLFAGLLPCIFLTSVIALSPPPYNYAPTSGKIQSFAFSQTSCFVSLLPTGAKLPVTLRADRKACRAELEGMQVTLVYADMSNPDCKAGSPCKFQQTIHMIQLMEKVSAPQGAGASAHTPE